MNRTFKCPHLTIYVSGISVTVLFYRTVSMSYFLLTVLLSGITDTHTQTHTHTHTHTHTRTHTHTHKHTNTHTHTVVKAQRKQRRSEAGITNSVLTFMLKYRGADKSLARPGRKEARATKL